jgi:hypothetical protein
VYSKSVFTNSSCFVLHFLKPSVDAYGGKEMAFVKSKDRIFGKVSGVENCTGLSEKRVCECPIVTGLQAAHRPGNHRLTSGNAN